MTDFQKELNELIDHILDNHLPLKQDQESGVAYATVKKNDSREYRVELDSKCGCFAVIGETAFNPYGPSLSWELGHGDEVHISFAFNEGIDSLASRLESIVYANDACHYERDGVEATYWRMVQMANMLLYVCGADPHPFSSKPWPNPWTDVLRTMKTVRRKPTYHEVTEYLIRREKVINLNLPMRKGTRKKWLHALTTEPQPS